MKTKLFFLLAVLILTQNCFSQSVNRLWNAKTGFLMYLSIYQIDVGDAANADFLEYYQSKFDRSEYNRCRNNEFEWKAYCTRTINTVRNEVREVNFDTTYTFYSDCKFGLYNMEDESFPLFLSHHNNGFQASSIFGDNPKMGNFVNRIFYLDLINEFEFYTIKMDKYTAQTFIQQRTATNGNVNRFVYARVKLKIIPKQNINSERSTKSFIAHIVSVEYFADKKYENSLGIIYSAISWEQQLLLTPLGKWVNDSNPADTLSITPSVINKTPYFLSAKDYKTGLFQFTPVRYELEINTYFELIIVSDNRIIIQNDKERKIYRRRV